MASYRNAFDTKNEESRGINMIKCCKEHVELALEVVVDEYEVAPVIEKIKLEEQLSTTCEYCQNTAIYIVSN